MAESMTAAEAERRFLAATPVKSNPVREVRTDGEYFYKLDRRGGHALKCEFAAAELLAERRVPAVEHLRLDRISAGWLLVTRALPGAVTVRDYAAKHVPDVKFRTDFAVFIRDFLRTGLDHRDLHIGNILYQEPEQRFVLVDLRSVRPWRWWWRRMPYDICRAPLELRRELKRHEICAMLKIVGVRDAEAFFDRALETEAAALGRMWKKRRRQLFSAYPKFSRLEGGVLVLAELSGEELKRLEWAPGTPDDFAESFYEDLAELPHRRILAWDAAKNLVGLDAAPPPSRLPADELTERRRIFGVPLRSTAE